VLGGDTADVPRRPRSGASVSPTFTSSFTDNVVFVNTAGVMLPCTAAGRPSPTVTWVRADSGQPVIAVPRLLEQLGNGSLWFRPFADVEYSAAVHSAARLRCMATNDVGTVLSKLVRVRAGQFVVVSEALNTAKFYRHIIQSRKWIRNIWFFDIYIYSITPASQQFNYRDQTLYM